MNLLKFLSLKHPNPKASAPALDAILQPVDEPFRGALLSMYRGEAQIGRDGQRHELDSVTRIVPRRGKWLYQLCCELKPKATLEIGMAYGFSSVFFLAAAAKNGLGFHTAIDPFENSYWHGIGLHKVSELGALGSMRFIENCSVCAFTDLCREGCRFDLIFVDGNHRFDDVLVDFTLYAQLCPVGGHIILDDTWMPSVRTAVAFIRTNRTDFTEVPGAIDNMALFERVAEDSRAWDQFTRFTVGR